LENNGVIPNNFGFDTTIGRIELIFNTEPQESIAR